jgi:transcriptional regulator with XRE-family HTH domain
MKSLRETRREHCLTQDMVEELTGIDSRQISMIERGLQKPNDSTRARLEEVLGKIDWLETTGVQVLGSYIEAERLIKRLVGITVVMDKKDQMAIKKLITKYFKPK